MSLSQSMSSYLSSSSAEKKKKTGGGRDDFVELDSTQVLGHFPNKAARKLLAEEWERLTPQQQMHLKAVRSKRGVHCDVCGLYGYYRENCPNLCVTPPGTPDSLDSTPPTTPRKRGDPIKSKKKKDMDEGFDMVPYVEEQDNASGGAFFWGANKDSQQMVTFTPAGDNISLLDSLSSIHSATSTTTGSRSKRSKSNRGGEGEEEKSVTSVHQLKTKVDLSNLRPIATNEVEQLRKSDAKVDRFAFFNYANQTYARTYAELTLQQVMRRMMRLVEQQLLSNVDNLTATFDTTLLAPPKDVIEDTFYPKDFLEVKEFREYFYHLQNKEKPFRTYQYQGHARPDEDLDLLFRVSKDPVSSLYKVKKNAGESIHAKNNWKSTLAKHDTLANSDPNLRVKQEKMNALFANQSKWIALQSTSMKYQNDRYEHLVMMLRWELQREHQREYQLLSCESKRASKDAAMEIYQQRLSAVDLMMRVLQSYHFTAGLEEADFLMFCLKEWEDNIQRRLGGDTSTAGAGTGGGADLQGTTTSAGGAGDGQAITGEGNNRTGTGTTSKTSGGYTNATSFLTEKEIERLPEKERLALIYGKDNIWKQRDDRMKKKQAEAKVRNEAIQMMQKKSGIGGKKDLVSKETHPYFHDTQFLQQLEKKHERMYKKSKAGKAFSASDQRELMKQEALRRSQSRQAEDEEDNQIITLNEETLASLQQRRSQANRSRDGYDDDNDDDDRSFSMPTLTRTNSYESVQSHNTANSAQQSAVVSFVGEGEGKSGADALLPSMADILGLAESHSTLLEERKSKRIQQREHVQKSKPQKQYVVQRKPHPREVDAAHIAKVKKSFRMAGLGNRIRKGNDDDYAHALPALIPIPQAFDGNSQVSSYTGQNIIFQLKKDMVLSDLGKHFRCLYHLNDDVYIVCLHILCRLFSSNCSTIVCT